MKRLLILALFVAVIVTLGMALLAVPNIELVTASCFLAGYLLGYKKGMFVAAVGEFLYSILNPMGAPGPPLLLAQIVGMSLAALTGAFVAKRKIIQTRENDEPASWGRSSPRWKNRLALGLIGALLTLIFDLLTTLSYLLFAGFSPGKLVTSLLYGLSFYIVHIGANFLLFIFFVPAIVPILKQRIWYRYDHIA